MANGKGWTQENSEARPFDYGRRSSLRPRLWVLVEAQEKTCQV